MLRGHPVSTPWFFGEFPPLGFELSKMEAGFQSSYLYRLGFSEEMGSSRTCHTSPTYPLWRCHCYDISSVDAQMVHLGRCDILAFFGGGRLGEILRCRRCDLILPSDTCEEGVFSCFLELQKFKSLFRQPAKIQHMRISDKTGVKLLEKIYSGMVGDQPLFFGTASQYRRRWDFLLATFKNFYILAVNTGRATRRLCSVLLPAGTYDFSDPMGYETSALGNT